MPYDQYSRLSDFSITTFFGFEAYVYGAEYQFTYKNVAIGDDVPCAICKVTLATTTMMVPAKLVLRTGRFSTTDTLVQVTMETMHQNLSVLTVTQNILKD